MAIALAASAGLAVPNRAFATAKTCDPNNPTGNTTSVLCFGTSVCTATTVTVNENIEVTSGGCDFDLTGPSGPRSVVFNKTFQMIGSGYIKVTNAANMTITGTGKLKARGDFVMPNGFIIQGGLISLVGTGFVTLQNGALIDVSGDAAGTIVLQGAGADASGLGINLANGTELRGVGQSSFVDTGDRFTDGGLVQLTATTGGIFDSAAINLPGANQGAGGEVDMLAGRSISIVQPIDAHGGGGDGGSIDVTAGDNITISKIVDTSSTLGGGFGGDQSWDAGEDGVGLPSNSPSFIAGGTFTLDAANGGQLKVNGSDAETSGGDGGDIDISALATVASCALAAPNTCAAITVTANNNNAIQTSGGTLFDGSGGTIFMDAGDFDPNRIGPRDGAIIISAGIVANGGAQNGDGGELDISAGRQLIINGPITMVGEDSGGDLSGDSGTTTLLNGVIDVHAGGATGDGGSVDFASGLAQGGASGALTVAKNVLATSGTQNGNVQSLSFAGCTLTVNGNVKIDGTGGTNASNISGGADLELIAVSSMVLQSGSQYIAIPAGTITLTHPANATVQRAGAVFNPQPIDNVKPITSGFYPNCPVCGDSIRQLGEVCDKGAGADGSCCNSDCSAFTCATPTVTSTPTSTRTATPVPTPTRTATATVAIATVTATPTAAVATATRTSTPGVPTATVTPGPGATATATMTATRTSTPVATTTATSTPAATATATTTATRTSTPVVTTTATSTPAATATTTSTPTATATSGATSTAAGATATPVATTTATATPVATTTATSTAGATTTPLATVTATTTAVATATATTTPVPTVTATTTPALTSTAVATATTTPVATVTVTATTTFAATPTVTVTPVATTTATASPTFAATATPTSTVTSTRTATPTASSTPTRSPTPTASATFNGTGTPQPATPSPTPNANPLTAKAADKCQKGIKRAGAIYTAKRLKSLDKCVNGVLRCVQEKPGDSGCLDKATIACSGEMIGGRGSLEADFRNAIASKCENEGLTIADLLDPDTIGFDGVASECAAILGSSVASIGDVADCVLAQHECTAERIFGAQEPRAGELLTIVRNRGASFDAPPCLADFGTGGAVDAPLNKAVDKCEAQIKSAGSKFTVAKLRSLERCVDALFSCDVVKPGDSSCLAKASSTCSRELAKVQTEAAKIGPSIDKRCSADSLAFSVLAGTDGANLDALAPTCADVGVSPLDSVAAYETCLFRQHSCEAEELLRFEAPRSEELLSQLSPPVALHSNFCPATP